MYQLGEAGQREARPLIGEGWGSDLGNKTGLEGAEPRSRTHGLDRSLGMWPMKAQGGGWSGTGINCGARGSRVHSPVQRGPRGRRAGARRTPSALDQSAARRWRLTEDSNPCGGARRPVPGPHWGMRDRRRKELVSCGSYWRQAQGSQDSPIRISPETDGYFRAWCTCKVWGT
jgi:hypothetical protein